MIRDYSFTQVSRRRLKKLPPNVQARVIKKLDYYLDSSDPLRFAEILTDFRLGHYRFRIGDYRVIFDVEEDLIVIHDVCHRREIYR